MFVHLINKKSEEGKTENLAYILSVFAVLILFFIKSFYLYREIEIGKFSAVFGVATVFITGAVFALIYHFSRKAAIIFLFTIYSLISLFMCIDLSYYSYARHLPSCSQIPMLTMIGGISNTVNAIVTMRQMWLVVDLPIWFIFAAVIKNKFNYLYSIKINLSTFKRIICAVVALSFIIIAVVCFVPSFAFRYLKNEIITYHVLDIADNLFGSFAVDEVDSETYAMAYPEEEEHDELWGVAQGRNVIVIQIEAMQAFVINREYNGQVITPFLNSLLEDDTIYFDNYYYQIGGGNTSDAEFAVNNSLFAPENESAYMRYTDNKYYGLPYLLKDNGYTGAYAFHGYEREFWNRDKAYPNQGFDHYYSGEQFDQVDIIEMGISDREFFMQSVDIMKTFEEPFYSFMITLSSHYPYNIPIGYRYIELLPEHEGTLFGLYIEAMRYVDKALETLFIELKESGLYENSIVVMYGDHMGLPNYDWQSKQFMSEFLGHEYYENDVFKVPLIIHAPNAVESQTVSVTGGHVDVLPTLLHLLGIENDKSVMFGQDLFTAEEGFVCQQAHMARGSFIDDEIVYVMAQNQIDLNSDVYKKSDGSRVDPSKYYYKSELAKKRIEDCMYILENDLVVFEETDEQQETSSED